MKLSAENRKETVWLFRAMIYNFCLETVGVNPDKFKAAVAHCENNVGTDMSERELADSIFKAQAAFGQALESAATYASKGSFQPDEARFCPPGSRTC